MIMLLLLLLLVIMSLDNIHVMSCHVMFILFFI